MNKNPHLRGCRCKDCDCLHQTANRGQLCTGCLDAGHKVDPSRKHIIRNSARQAPEHVEDFRGHRATIIMQGPRTRFGRGY